MDIFRVNVNQRLDLSIFYPTSENWLEFNIDAHIFADIHSNCLNIQKENILLADSRLYQSLLR